MSGATNYGASTRWPPWAPALALVAAVVLAYLPVFEAGFVWDDDGHVTPPALRSSVGLWRIWTDPTSAQQYYPLTHTLFWVEHRLFGDAPLPYHVANLALHAAVALVFWRLLVRLAVPGALLAAFVFALHPIEVETVAWVSEQKNTLSALLALLALHAWLSFDTDGERTFARWRTAFLLFLCALAAKTVTAVLPGAILVIVWWRDGRVSARRTVLPLLPFLAAGIAAGLVTARLEREVGGVELGLSAAERVVLAGRAAWFYLGELAWPAGRCFVHPRFVLDAGDPLAWIAPAAAALAVGLLAWLASRAERIGRIEHEVRAERADGAERVGRVERAEHAGRLRRAPLAAALLYGGALFPALGFVDVLPFLYSFVADHFQYLAGLAPIALAASGWARLRERAVAGARRSLDAAAIALCAALGALSFAHARDFRDAETLWRATIACNPGAFLAWSNLASHLNERGRHAEALEAAEGALRAKPDDARAFVNRAIALERLGSPHEALASLDRAIALAPDDPAARANRGQLLLGLGRADEALAELERAVALGSTLAIAHANLGNARLALGRSDEALASYARALELDPASPQAWYNLGVARGKRRELDQAEVAYRRAVELDPAWPDPRYNLAILHLELGRRGEARAGLEEVVRRDPTGPVGARARDVLRTNP